MCPVDSTMSPASAQICHQELRHEPHNNLAMSIDSSCALPITRSGRKRPHQTKKKDTSTTFHVSRTGSPA